MWLTINHAISNRLTANLLNNELSLSLIDRGIWFTSMRCNEARYACMRFNNMTCFNAPHVNSISISFHSLFSFTTTWECLRADSEFMCTSNPDIDFSDECLAANAYQTNSTHIGCGCRLPLLHHVRFSSFRKCRKSLTNSVFIERHVNV